MSAQNDTSIAIAQSILTTPVKEHIEIHAMKRLDLFLYVVIYFLRHTEFLRKTLSA
jgi:hypothetical protein